MNGRLGFIIRILGLGVKGSGIFPGLFGWYTVCKGFVCFLRDLRFGLRVFVFGLLGFAASGPWYTVTRELCTSLHGIGRGSCGVLVFVRLFWFWGLGIRLWGSGQRP